MSLANEWRKVGLLLFIDWTVGTLAYIHWSLVNDQMDDEPQNKGDLSIAIFPNLYKLQLQLFSIYL